MKLFVLIALILCLHNISATNPHTNHHSINPPHDIGSVDPNSLSLFARQAFDQFDTDGSGFIEQDELPHVLETVFNLAFDTEPSEGEPEHVISQEFCSDILRTLDFNQDGKLSFDEFQVILTTWVREQNSNRTF